jgi:hypothetical protein
MVDVAQLVEPRIVIPAVVGSSPIVHPTRYWGSERRDAFKSHGARGRSKFLGR